MGLLEALVRPWLPEGEADKELIRHELAAILASSEFRASKRYPALLTYLVETTLAGKAAKLKERTIGCEVFERALDYDTTSDPVVRYNAGQVRRRLTTYYYAEGAASEIQILLPAGSYIPEFRRKVMDGADPADSSSIPAEPTILADPLPIPEAPSREHLGGPVKLPVRMRLGAILFLIAIGCAASVLSLRHRNALETLWQPFWAESQPLLIVTEPIANVEIVAPGRPLISLETGLSLSRISGLCQSHAKASRVQFSSATTLDQMRGVPVVILAYSTWAQRLMAPLRYKIDKFGDRTARILDQSQPSSNRWTVDFQKTPQTASFTDYAIVGRFNDTITGGPVMVLVGIGRDGSDAASEFVTSRQYLDLLASKIPRSSLTKSFEVVISTRVVEGRRGAPQIEAVYIW